MVIGALNHQLPLEPHTSCLIIVASAWTHSFTSPWRRKGCQTAVDAAAPRTPSGCSSFMSPSGGPAVLPLHAAPPCLTGPRVRGQRAEGPAQGALRLNSQASLTQPGPTSADTARMVSSSKGPGFTALTNQNFPLLTSRPCFPLGVCSRKYL